MVNGIYEMIHICILLRINSYQESENLKCYEYLINS